MKKQGEGGFVLVVSLVLLVILALFGIFATRIATTEFQISGNERVYTESFYHTESMLVNLAQKIQNENVVNLENNELDKDNLDSDGNDGLVVIEDIADYDPSDKGNINDSLEEFGYKVDGENSKKKFLAVNKGPTSSLVMSGGSQVYDFDIFARSQEGGTDKIIKIGFKKRY